MRLQERISPDLQYNAVMAKRGLHNYRWIASLLALAVMLMSSASGASWQCPDGHLCPPNCTMQHPGHKSRPSSNALKACCIAKKAASDSTPLCETSSKSFSAHDAFHESCTSSVCVFKAAVKSEANAPTYLHFSFDFDGASLPITFDAPVVAPEKTVCLCFSSLRAPPLNAVLCLSTPRAPPA